MVGLFWVDARLADGTLKRYYYAWKGGPRLYAKPGTRAFVEEYLRAIAGKPAKQPHKPQETLRGLVTLYRSSPEFKGLSDNTRREWIRWLDRLSESDLAELPYDALNDPRVRRFFVAWRDTYADRPRASDYGVQVLSRLMGWSVQRGILLTNHALGIQNLYSNNRADQIWTAEERQLYIEKSPTPEASFIIEFACMTGLRREDQTKALWSHVGDDALVMQSQKGDKEVVIPLLPETKALFARIKAQQMVRHEELLAVARKKGRPLPLPPTVILSNTRGKPWTPSGLGHQVIDVKTLVGIDKHLHDARGTFATLLRGGGLSGGEIADILGWEEDRVKALLKKYVDRASIVKDLARRLGPK